MISKCRVGLFYVLMFFYVYDKAQNFIWPLDSPRILTGNYGELRPNHFHAGLDFSTHGRINVPVYCIEDGYVSRVRVSAFGYGKSVYVTHKNGKVSVYAHLNAYSTPIAAYVKKEQYAKQSFEVDLFPKPGELKLAKKDYVGLSGNTGGSSGPHLHFEIRDEKTEVPLNPLNFYKIKDSTSPTIDRIGFFSLSDTTAPRFLSAHHIKLLKRDSARLVKDSVILNQGIIGFAFSGYDQFIKNGNHNNIYGAKLFYDGRLIYAHSLNGVSFDYGRYANEFSVVVDVTKKDRVKFQKCFLPTLYPQGLYDYHRLKGRILITDTSWHKLRLLLFDESGNTRVLNLTFKTRKLNYYTAPTIKSDVRVECTEDFMIAKNKLQIYIPANTLYSSTNLIFENTIESTGKMIILPTEANLNTTSIVGFEVPKRFMRIKNKLVLKSGDNVLPPIVHNDSVFYSVKNLGWFILDKDTIAPTAKAQLTAAQFQYQKKPLMISFIINDNLSGISRYKLFLNEKWVLAEYEPKTHSLTYYFDEQTPTGALNFMLELEDKVGNRTVLKHTVKR
jgi:hypothetical protein